jgi:hypothetical protein
VVYEGDHGAREVDDEFAAELRLLLEPLHGLAKASGGRLLADTVI